ncbi:Altered inheritance of mitochondria protein 18 mitochondrial [Ascosphaera aggregata]|nr:Altered inheritance of mitochondria protein 18 mitochondrial [Ascosphaera aggregata]
MATPLASSQLLLLRRPPLRFTSAAAASHIYLRPLRCTISRTSRTVRSFTTTPPSSASAFVERRRQRARDVAAAGSIDPEVIAAVRWGYYKKRMVVAISGLIASAIGLWVVIKCVGELEGEKKTKKDENDLSVGEDDEEGRRKWDSSNKDGGSMKKSSNTSWFPRIGLDGPEKGVEMVIEGQKKFLDGVEQVETGNKVVPTLPKILRIPKSLGEPGTLDTREPGKKIPQNAGEADTEEYQLLGIGVRYVSFINFHVYVVGMYVATTDLPALQKALLSTAVSPTPDTAGAVVTSLVPGEREGLKELLLDAEKGPERWNRLIRDTKIKTIFRIVPTRNTDMAHMRDSWVRSLTAKAQEARTAAAAAAAGGGNVDDDKSEYADPSLQSAIVDLKMMGLGHHKSVRKGEAVMLLRGRTGSLELLTQPPNKPTAPLTWLGCVRDERVSRVLWSKYVAGKVVASEEARQSIINGMLDLVKRPTGAVEQRVL